MSKVEETRAIGIFTEQEIETAIARANKAVTNLGEITIATNFNGDWSTIFVDEDVLLDRQQELDEKRKRARIESTWGNTFSESMHDILESKVKNMLDDEFLEKLKFIVRSYGWNGDLHEVADFASWCYKLTGKSEHDFEPFL